MFTKEELSEKSDVVRSEPTRTMDHTGDQPEERSMRTMAPPPFQLTVSQVPDPSGSGDQSKEDKIETEEPKADFPSLDIPLEIPLGGSDKQKAKRRAKSFLKALRKEAPKRLRDLFDSLITELLQEIENETITWEGDQREQLREYLKGDEHYLPLYNFVFKTELASEKQDRIARKERLDAFSELTAADLDQTVFKDIEPEDFDESRVQTIKSVLDAMGFEELIKKPAVKDASVAEYVSQLIYGHLTQGSFTLDQYLLYFPQLRSQKNKDWVLEKVDQLISEMSYDAIVNKKGTVSSPEVLTILEKYEQIKYRKYQPSDFEEPNPTYDLAELRDKKDISFREFQYAYHTETDPKYKSQILSNAISAARTRMKTLDGAQNAEPIAGLLTQYNQHGLLNSTFQGDFVPNCSSQIALAYQAMVAGSPVPPWTLLAIWYKEGSGKKDSLSGWPYAVSTPQNAKSLFRSMTYYENLGADHFIHYTAHPNDDNTVETNTDTDALAHEAKFKKTVLEQQRLGNIPKGKNYVSAINNTMTVSGTPGSYTVTASDKFYTLSLVIAGAFYKQNADQLSEFAEETGRVKGAVPPELEEAIAEAEAKGDQEKLKQYLETKKRFESDMPTTWEYVHWNAGKGGFKKTLKSAEKHIQEKDVIKEHGNISPTEFAFETKPKKNEHGQTRENAIRFDYYAKVFEMIFNGWE